MSKQSGDKSVVRQLFERLGWLAGRVKGYRFIDRVFKRWLGDNLSKNWAMDAQTARMHQEPVKARTLLYAVVLVVIGLLTWAAFAPLDEVAKGEGKVIPSRQLQIVQSLDGGIVRNIHVREGQIVEEGQSLITIDQTRFLSDLQERQAQATSLRAELLRLNALTSDQPLIFDEAFSQQSPELVENEIALYYSSLQELEEQKAIARNQLTQRQQDLREAQSASQQYQTTLRLTRDELQRTRPLLATGAVSEVDILRLERDVANLQGELERAHASMSRASAAIEEAGSKINEVQLSATNRWRSQMSEARARLDAIEQAETGLQDRVNRAELTAPVRGTVQRIMTNTIGGIITPGRDVIEIVPLDDQLLIEARIAPKDIAFVRPGQHAMIKFTAYDFAIFGGIPATVEHISADTITDERDNTFYLARLTTEKNAFAPDLSIIPGMTTQVDIVTGQKTVLQYLLKPVLRATSEAMRER
ncbi:MAG: HlyD family type I secretion periplasmic adaptor subunit [Pseudomonadaceae bacterium]|nr:MAG: HlyD family type I secretion periplasmic adaptor subunit [Pseudomonadaceae bacterium]